MLSNDSSIKIINRNSNRGEPSKKMNKDEDHNDSIEILYQTTNEQCVRELKVLLFVESVAVRIYTMDVSYLCNEYDIITTIFPFYEIYKDELGYRVVENGTLKRIELNAVRDPKCSYQYIIKIETVSKERKPLKFFGDFYVREEVQTKQPFQCLTPKSVDLQEPYFEEEQLDLHKSRETKTTRLYPSIIENNEQKSSSPSQKPVELSDSPILTRDNLPMHSKSSKDTILAVYPPPPERGGITIYKENYKCLGDSEYLNDVVIDFYLKYLTNEILKKEDRNRTHIFSSQFFTRLSKPPDTNKDAKVVIPESERRHIGVQRWTKNINIFEKDFVIIPINEHFHWYLAIICYAHLVDVINNYSQTLIRPCILFFDSLSNKNKDRIAAILRGYLSQEYLAKMGKQKNFSSNTLKIIYPRIPKQSNATDCGLYVLQIQSWILLSL
ncbi:sentrin-specific protease 6-like isoform X2 [Phymastichus coffea]|uniref:sentrin-specific protease 6-like isoform X2 n=1 Tax=Phymastichus coffea TaxID=108790 RepID=UPI00273CD11A|nr:sentrin-specific protease 6-like isoform X2 [Phymastichus coffea]